MLINNNLKNCREELEITQEELGKVLGVSRKTVTGWENNYDTMPLRKMVQFSNLYKYSLDYITGLSSKNEYVKIDKLDKKKIGNNLKELRVNLKMTQKQIADECMISQTTYSNYETGQYLITTLTLYTICYNHKLSIYNIIR
ncbi:TPA: transcriptional regulator [Candidatus Ventrenecus stercoripullorum]|nr:transcriptional regulator [Candidatus Ventrenecus stercoripullorum]